jgi:choline dehydrogenase-like flavoprotein
MSHTTSHSNAIKLQNVDQKTVAETLYDAVVVGSGVSGAIIANELAQQGFRVLILEAGPGHDLSIPGYENYLTRFYTAVSKDSNAPFAANRCAPMPRSTEVRRLHPGQPNTEGYIVQNGPFVTDSSYSRVVGGTTMHFESKTPRMLPEDFEMRTRFGVGLDWPISYTDLMPYYTRAEFELGVSGDVESQKALGIEFPAGYVFPMKEMPPTYLDLMVAKDLNGTELELDGDKYTLGVSTFPQGRNGIPNEQYKAFNGGKDFVPVGAVSRYQADTGGRCQGNTNCTPLCPVQAKYDARKTLAKAIGTGHVHLLAQSVASKVHTDCASGRVTQIDFKTYHDTDSSAHVTGTAKGKIFVIAANAVENARLLLASGISGSSALVGRNLMDHPYLLAWGLMPEVAGTMRGTICTSGISNLRGGRFRRNQAAFAIDIHNDGWGWATGAPNTNLLNIVENLNKFGAELRAELVQQISRQLLLACMVELLPEPGNRVTVDPSYADALGNLKPVVSFSLPDYTMTGIAYARALSRRIFQRLGAEDHSSYDPLDPGYVTYNGEGFAIHGGNHLAGTHIMGTSPANSVVNSKQRSWDHENLYLAGPGSMPTIGTSNTTLTLAALCYMTADAIAAELRK